MRSNAGTSETRDSSRWREPSASTNSSTGENRSDSSGSKEGSSSTSSGSGEDRTDSSGSREAAASSAPEGDHWPLFTSKIKGSNRWIPIKSECRLYGCDFADISFRCEVYCKLEKPGASEDQLLDIARSFMLKGCCGCDWQPRGNHWGSHYCQRHTPSIGYCT
jgi:hypothetical protein